MIAMVQHDEPRDFVIGTNTSYSVQQACEIAFRLCWLGLA